MSTPKKQVRHPVQCVVVGAVRLDSSQWMLDLACGWQTIVASVGKPRNVRMRCRLCESKARTVTL